MKKQVKPVLLRDETHAMCASFAKKTNLAIVDVAEILIRRGISVLTDAEVDAMARKAEWMAEPEFKQSCPHPSFAEFLIKSGEIEVVNSNGVNWVKRADFKEIKKTYKKAFSVKMKMKGKK